MRFLQITKKEPIKKNYGNLQLMTISFFLLIIGFVSSAVYAEDNLVAQNIDLNKKEEALKKEEERLNVLKAELTASIEKYTKVLEQIDNAIKELKETQNKNLRHIAKAYEAMSPEDAAARLSNLDRTTAVKILLLMNSKKAGAIIGMMPTTKATQITKDLAKISP